MQPLVTLTIIFGCCLIIKIVINKSNIKKLVAAVCAVALCGPCLLACARRLVLGDELLRRGGTLREAEVLGCDEPACPYYKKNMRFLMVPATRRRQYTSPTRITHARINTL